MPPRQRVGWNINLPLFFVLFCFVWSCFVWPLHDLSFDLRFLIIALVASKYIIYVNIVTSKYIIYVNIVTNRIIDCLYVYLLDVLCATDDLLFLVQLLFHS